MKVWILNPYGNLPNENYEAAISANSFQFYVSTGAGGGEFYAFRAAISAQSF